MRIARTSILKHVTTPQNPAPLNTFSTLLTLKNLTVCTNEKNQRTAKSNIFTKSADLLNPRANNHIKLPARKLKGFTFTQNLTQGYQSC